MKLYIPRLVFAVCVGVLLVAWGTGCKNTAHGAGKDIENAGEKIQQKTD